MFDDNLTMHFVSYTEKIKGVYVDSNFAPCVGLLCYGSIINVICYYCYSSLLIFLFSYTALYSYE